MNFKTQRVFYLLILGFALGAPDLARGEQWFNVNAVALMTENGETLGKASDRSSMLAFFKAEKRIVYQILDKIGVLEKDLPPEVRSVIDKPHTTNFQAFLAYSQGLDFLDKREFRKAEEAFGRATQLDPDFGLAQQVKERMPDAQANVLQSFQSAVHSARGQALRSLGRREVGQGGSQLGGFLGDLASAAMASQASLEQAQQNNQKKLMPQDDIALAGGAGSGGLGKVP